jgi:preprotein translocase subunit SecG
MGLIITLLTGVLVIDCIILILLILMQLPKKEAGLGQAFGSTATDALFGAGSGNVLTKATKYAAGLFFILALFLSVATPRLNMEKRRTRDLENALSNRPGKSQTTPSPAQTAPALTASTALVERAGATLTNAPKASPLTVTNK